MQTFASPLRYPGGKAKLTALIAQIIAMNQIKGCVYAEPYVGGAGVALSLLYSERVSRIMINDYDRRISAFWRTIVNRPTKFLDLLEDTPVNVDEWHHQRAIYCEAYRYTDLHVGFAAFYLNRCNRSGILVNGGPIGGYDQSGKWKIDARYNREDLSKRIERVAMYKERISVYGLDALEFLREKVYPMSHRQKVFAYLDPPYYEKGQQLYLNAYDDSDHRHLANYIKRIKRLKWIVTYDNVQAIRDIYKAVEQTPFNLLYTANARREGHEILIHHKSVKVPDDADLWIRHNITA